MSKFNLTVNSEQSEGFKLSFNAEDRETLKVFQTLSEKLIDKITKIEVVSNQRDEDDY